MQSQWTHDVLHSIHFLLCECSALQLFLVSFIESKGRGQGCNVSMLLGGLSVEGQVMIQAAL